MLLGIRWGSLRTKILVWSLVPAAVILGAVALVAYLAFQQGAGDQWRGLLTSSPHYGGYLIALLILGLVLPAAVVAIGVRRVTRPVADLIDAASRVADGDLGYTIQVETGDEIEELAGQFN
ncbi:MAG: HAMP domain-containing protein, partial [Anaerolineae bacterium]